MTANVALWNEDQRRTSSYVVLGVAVALVVAGLAVWWFAAATPEWVYWILVGLLVLVLAFMAALLFLAPREKAMPVPENAPEAAPAESMMGTEYAPPTPASPAEPRILTLRCGDCGTIFEVTDTGERPLYHTCPGCGAEGALRDEIAPPAEAPQIAPEMPSAYAPPYPDAVEDAPSAAEPEPPAAPVKKLKLRCGGCKEVFTIEDTGERPLKRACPHCGRIGKIG